MIFLTMLESEVYIVYSDDKLPCGAFFYAASEALTSSNWAILI